MATKTKTRLCWNCEGSVSIEESNCLYCGVHLEPISEEEEYEDKAPPAPYSLGAITQEVIHQAPYAAEDVKPDEAVVNAPNTDSSLIAQEIRKTAITLTSLLLGCVLALFGIILFLFSNDDGIFTLNWHGSYWLFYLLLGIPLIYIGWKTSFDEEEI